MADRLLNIQFGLKFCQSQLSDFLKKDFGFKEDDERETLFQLSLQPNIEQVVFDLSITEWIATEEVTFLFSWIRQLVLNKKKVKIDLPLGYPLQRIYSPEKLLQLNKLYKFTDNDKRARKRFNRNVFLMVNWGLRTNTGLKQFDFDNLLEISIYNQRYDSLENDTFNKVVPFSALDARYDGSLFKFDGLFEEVLKGKKSKNSQNSLFDLETKVEDILIHHGCYTPFESKILSNVIFQELYLNSCQHSFSPNTIDDQRECYMATSFSSKRTANDYSQYANNLIDEIDLESIDFYKDKEAILKAMKKDVGVYEKFSKFERREAKLEKYSQIKNQSYLEYTFLDYGQGYKATLKEQYEANIDELRPLLSARHDLANEDARIIEYAFLLETSCIPISQNIDNYNLIPRGLYFIIDMIRRFKGLLKIRSGNALVFFDFSDKIYVEVNNHKPQIFIHPPYSVKECVIHSTHNEVFFEGNMISIVLPPKVFSRFKSENSKSLSPLRIDNGILNKYVYFRNEFDYNDLDPKSYEYISLLFLMNKVIEEYIQEESKLDNKTNIGLNAKELNRFFYNQLYSRLVNVLKSFHGKNCVIFIDFANLPFDSQILKLLYYIMDTPRINELTKAVLVNIDSEKLCLLDFLKEKINHDGLGPLLFKAIPCFDFSDITNLNNVKWIGLRDEKDEKILTDVLFGKQENVDKLNAIKNIEGNILYEYEGWVYSFLKPIPEVSN